MGVERIVSFFPSATELLYELGVGDKIFGVTHECLYPENAKSKSRVINSVFNPNDIKGILDSVDNVAKKIGMEERGRELIQSLQKRIDFIQSKNFDSRPRVLALEWLDPFFTSGHWVPEMIEIAGGKNEISSKGEQSRRMKIEEIAQSDPDIIVLMPCGFDIERTVSEYKKILQNDRGWNKIRAVRQQNVFAVDANSYFSKPSLRTVTGIEILAKMIHPEIFEKIKNPEVSFKQIKP